MLRESMKKIAVGVVSVMAAVSVIAGVPVSGALNTSYAAGMNTTGGIENLSVNDDLQIEGTEDSTTAALESALGFIKWLSLAGTLLLLGVFVINLLKLGASGTNVQARAAAQQGLIWSGISAAVLSIASTVFFFLGGILSGSVE